MSVYTTLAVRLAQSGAFTHEELWKNAVTYNPFTGKGRCGLFLTEVEEGRGRLTLFHAEETPEPTRALFEGFVVEHLTTHALPETIRRRQIIVCRDCGTPVSEIVVERVTERGRDCIECQVCGALIALQPTAGGETSKQLVEMGRVADANRDHAEATAIIEGKRATKDYDVFLCHRSNDKPGVRKIAKALMARKLLPWLDEWNIRPGERWQDALEKHIASIKLSQ